MPHIRGDRNFMEIERRRRSRETLSRLISRAFCVETLNSSSARKQAFMYRNNSVWNYGFFVDDGVSWLEIDLNTHTFKAKKVEKYAMYADRIGPSTELFPMTNHGTIRSNVIRNLMHLWWRRMRKKAILIGTAMGWFSSVFLLAKTAHTDDDDDGGLLRAWG